MNKKIYIISAIIILIVLLALVGFLQYSSKLAENGPGPLDEFTQCLKEKGAVFYGTFWCSHCNNTKKMFGSSKKYLPYEECSTPDAMGQLEKCSAIKIESYPTWIFADQSRFSGEITLEQLAEKTTCVLPSQIKK